MKVRTFGLFIILGGCGGSFTDPGQLLLEDLDADGSGELCIDEIPSTNALQVLRAVDQNGDESLDAREITAAMYGHERAPAGTGGGLPARARVNVPVPGVGGAPAMGAQMPGAAPAGQPAGGAVPDPGAPPAGQGAPPMGQGATP